MKKVTIYLPASNRLVSACGKALREASAGSLNQYNLVLPSIEATVYFETDVSMIIDKGIVCVTGVA